MACGKKAALARGLASRITGVVLYVCLGREHEVLMMKCGLQVNPLASL
jgi:hypothetical protein